MNGRLLTALSALADEPERKSQEVTDWAARIAWVVGLLLLMALIYWLMREGWKWRATLQGDLPEPPPLPEEALPGEAGPGPSASGGTASGPVAAPLRLTGRYHGSTTAGQWLDRIVAHGLGTRSRAELTLTAAGVCVVRPGARDFLIPAAHIRGARLDKGIAGKVLTEGGLLVITWELGDRLLDSGFRSDRAAEHAGWIDALGAFSPYDQAPGAGPHDPENDPAASAGPAQEGAR